MVIQSASQIASPQLIMSKDLPDASPQLTMSKDLPDRSQWIQMLGKDHPTPAFIAYQKPMQQKIWNDTKIQRCVTPEIPAMKSFHKVVKVLVGAAEVPFILHEEGLIRVSDYFKTACKEPWMKKSSKNQIGIIRYLSS
jgi:hypothetical protein